MGEQGLSGKSFDISRQSMGLGGVGFPRNLGCGLLRVVTGRRCRRQVCCLALAGGVAGVSGRAMIVACCP